MLIYIFISCESIANNFSNANNFMCESSECSCVHCHCTKGSIKYSESYTTVNRREYMHVCGCVCVCVCISIGGCPRKTLLNIQQTPTR